MQGGKMKRFTIILGLIIYLIIWNFGINAFAQSQMIADITTDIETEFGTYHPYLVEITPQATQYTVAPDFSNVVNFNEFEFSEADKDILKKNGFVVKPSYYCQIHHIYNYCYDVDIPVFVTTDAVLHAYHILYDYILRMLEVRQFADDLDNLNKEMLTIAQNKLKSAQDSTAKEAARKVLAYFTVSDMLLDSTGTPSSVVTELVQAELALIEAHQGYGGSPIFSYLEDYSQYVPRGHYTRSSLLEHYFMSMMWLGRMTFAMEPDNLPELTTEHTLMALIIVQALNSCEVNGETAMDVWSRIYDPTVFFVGKSDDLNIYQYTEIAGQVYGQDFVSLTVEELADSSLLTNFIELASELPGPLITSPLPGSTPKGFRFMGQRFIPDSYMFDRLTAPTVSGRLMPRGLDIMAVLGSERAQEILDQVYYENSNPYYVLWRDSMKVEFAAKPAGDWAQNLYWNWLYSLMPLLFAKDSGYPPFMQKTAWQDKELATSSGSWAELRHDTILYAKQSSSWESAPYYPPTLKGYVEPNPHLYARLAALARFMITGFDNRGILLDGFQKRLINLEYLLLNLKSISEKELTNEVLSAEEYVLIHKFGQIIETIITFPPEEVEQFENETDDQMPIIADVHTDALNNLVLEEGVGYPFDIFVIVPIEDTLKVARGAVFSYYEFSQPISDRLTDETWQEMLKSDNPVKLPEWTGSFIDTSQSFVNKNPFPYNAAEFYTGISDKNMILTPGEFALKQNYPNPFNASTTISYEIPNTAIVNLRIYDVAGKEVKTLVDKIHNTGKYTINWNGRDNRGNRVSSGLYFIRLEQNNQYRIIKTALIH
jgi:hypothetical protein